MTRADAINIIKQYRKKPTLINEIETVEEGVWLVEALDMAIKALEQEPVLDKIRAEIEKECEPCIYEIDFAYKHGLLRALEIIDKYRVGDEK